MLLLLPLIFLLSCSCPEHPKTAKDDRALIVAISDDPSSFDPRLVRDLNSATIMRMMFEGLTRANSDGIFTPALAENITISKDLKTYTFTLKDTLWSDGTPLTSDDIKLALNAIT